MIILGTNSIKETGFNVANSCRFNDASDDNLTRTFSAQTTRTKHSISFWCKRATLGHTQFLFEGTGGTYPTQIYFSSGDILALYDAGENASYSTIAKFRDPSAWMHVLCRIDTTQASNENRVRFYVNGVLSPTSQSNSISQSTNVSIGKGGTHTIGKRGGASDSFDGYLCEFIYVYNVSHEPTDFGEFDSDSGIWKPLDGLADSLTFGNNGFYLDFQDSSALGNDVSGNNTDFTANNLTAIDQSTDTCTNNFATLNPLCTGSLITLSEGNLKATGNNASDSSTTTATIGITSGKFYWEAKIVNVVSGYPYLGIYEDFDSLVQGNLQGQANGTRVMTVYVVGGGTTLFKPGTDLTITAPANDNIIMFAVDKDNNKFYMGVNGSWYNSGDPTSGATGTGSLADLDANGVVMFGSHNYNNSATELNFGSPPYSESGGNSDGNGYGNFAHAVPGGYYSLNTKNLAEYG